jgi:hypothetical protein
VLAPVLGCVKREFEKGLCPGKSAAARPGAATVSSNRRRRVHEALRSGGSDSLREEFERILADVAIGDAEELEQVELQAVFALSYDDPRLSEILSSTPFPNCRDSARTAQLQSG